MIYSSSPKTRRILEKLQHNALTAKEVFEKIFSVNPDTFKVAKRLLRYMEPPKKLTPKELRRIEQKKFYTLLSKLNREGLIKKQGGGGSAILHLTKQGLQKLLRRPRKREREVRLPRHTYQQKKTRDQIIFIFDIPECFRPYRDWIRNQLESLDFRKLQKSVWIGSSEIPDNFVHDLRECNMLQYIHIFKVTKNGSLPE